MINFLRHQIPFINTSWVVAHNSFANWKDGWHLNPQQTFNLEGLFERGVRGFMIDIHYHNNEASLCHEITPQKDLQGSCSTTKWMLFAPILKLESFLIRLHNIIIKNPNEIIILFLECYIPMKDVATSFDNINLTQFLLKTNPNNPTLLIENIIAKRTPLIVFSDYAHSNQKPINGFFYTKNYKESKYDLAEYQGCEDRDETSRTRYNEKAYNNQIINLFLLNHFYKTSFKVPGAI